MPDTLSPPRPVAADRPDPEFWGPLGPARGGGLSRPTAPVGLLDGVIDRLRAWRADPRVGAVVLVALALVAGFAWYRIGMGSGGGSGAAADEPAAAAPSPASAAEATTVPTDPSAAPAGSAGGDARLMVHVAGAVTRPGVVELEGGARVIDAVEAAGGGLAEADLDRLNLAAPLADGQRVLVQRFGEPPAPSDPPAGGVPAADGGGASAGVVNVNTATAEQLETLPGIGPVLAEAIIAERDRRGGFRSVNELRDVRGIGDQRFADLEGLVTV